jgi:hypothetical protein
MGWTKRLDLFVTHVVLKQLPVPNSHHKPAYQVASNLLLSIGVVSQSQQVVLTSKDGRINIVAVISTRPVLNGKPSLNGTQLEDAAGRLWRRYWPISSGDGI